MPRFDRLMESLAGIEPVMAVFWLGLVIFTAGLAVLMYTRWGQYRPLRKCMGLSLLAHLMLAGYAATIHIATPIPQPAEPIIHVSIGDGPVEKAAGGGASPSSRTRTSSRGRYFPTTRRLSRSKRNSSAARPVRWPSRNAWCAPRMRDCPAIPRSITWPWPRRSP